VVAVVVAVAVEQSAIMQTILVLVAQVAQVVLQVT
jgi:hypothetical protein